MVWIYGGGFTSGSGGTAWYDDSQPAGQGEIGDIVNGNQHAMRLDGYAVQDEAAKDDSAMDPVPSWAVETAGALTVTGPSGATITLGTSEFNGVSVNLNGLIQSGQANWDLTLDPSNAQFETALNDLVGNVSQITALSYQPSNLFTVYWDPANGGSILVSATRVAGILPQETS